jgi:hypothetical protein
VVDHRTYASDLAHTNLGLEKHTTDEVGSVVFGIGAVFGWWVSVSGVAAK